MNTLRRKEQQGAAKRAANSGCGSENTIELQPLKPKRAAGAAKNYRLKI